MAPDSRLGIIVYVAVSQGASGALTNEATVSGGGAATVSASSANEINSAPAPFGPFGFQFYKAASDGAAGNAGGGAPV